MAVSNWVLDEAHSSIGFTVRHMMIANVRGYFGKFTATVAADPENLTTANITVTIDPASIDTRNEQRDNHLRSADFFQTEEYPEITFQSSTLQSIDDEQHRLEGYLTIHDVSKPLAFNCEIAGPAKDPWGNARIGVTANGTLKRSDFGLTYNSALETGGFLIGDEIKFIIELEFVKEA
ncbi:MAG: YceI family protein [Bacilli bacterium]